MSRSNYSDDCDGWQLIMWRGAVKSAIRGQRGQAMLRELIEALDAMPVKRLIADELVHEGGYCALGVLGEKRGLPMTGVDIEDAQAVSKLFGVARALAAEIVYENDEGSWGHETQESRWSRMRTWVANRIAVPA